MKRTLRFVLLAIAASGLTACATGRPAPIRSLYDLGAESAAHRLSPALGVELVMPGWLDSGEIVYRLLYDDPLRLRSYAGSRWAGKPARLIGARLKTRLADGPGPCSVRVEVEEFAQHFTRSDQSRQVLAARWTLRGANGQALVDDAARFTATAASADAKGGASAAAEVIDQLAVALASAAAAQETCAPGKATRS